MYSITDTIISYFGTVHLIPLEHCQLIIYLAEWQPEGKTIIVSIGGYW